MTHDTTTHGVFLTVTESGTVITQTPALRDGPPQYAQLHRLVGGYLECAMSIPTDTPGRMIHFYCDEDGLRKNLPYTITLRGHPIVGPLVVVAAEPPTILGMTTAEADAITDLIRRAIAVGT